MDMELLRIYFYQNAVDQAPPKTEPAAGAELLAAETEYELPVSVAFEGETYVHEFQVAETVLFGICQGFPDGQYTGVLGEVGFGHSS